VYIFCETFILLNKGTIIVFCIAIFDIVLKY